MEENQNLVQELKELISELKEGKNDSDSPTVTLTFKIPEQQEEMQRALDAGKYMSALWEFSNYLRSQYKYNDNLTEEQFKMVETIREKFYEIVNDENIEI